MDKLFLYGFGMWFLILICAVLNGIIRDAVYKAKVGTVFSNQISSVILCVVILGLSFMFLKIGNFDATSNQYLLLGLMWVILTVAFEFLFFHYVTNHSWEELLSNYNILKGNFWLLVVMTTGIAPFIASKFI